MELTSEEQVAFREVLGVLAAPNVSVAGGEYAFRRYLAALDILKLLCEKLAPVVPEEKPEESHG